MSMRTVLVTGGTGAIGGRLVHELRNRGWRARVLVHERNPVAADEIVCGDVTVAASLHAAVERVDTIVHAAAVTHARSARTYAEVNVEGTRNVVAVARAAGVN